MKLMFIFVGFTTALFVVGIGIYIALSNRYIEPYIAREQKKGVTKPPDPAPLDGHQ